MTQITIDAGTVAKLKDVREMVELRDERGRIVGHFVPGPPRDANGNVIIPISDEEIERRSRQQGGRPLKDIFRDLEKL
jgi:hypothetical protein